MEEKHDYSRSIFLILSIMLIALIAVILKATASVTIPVTLSVLFAFTLYPLLKKLNALHIPWGLSVVITLLLSLGIIYTVGNVLVSSTMRIVDSYSRYEERFTQIYTFFVKTFNLPYDENETLFFNLWNSLNLKSYIQNFAIFVSTNLINFLKVTLTVFLFLLFLLLELKTIHKKVDIAFENDTTREKVTNITGKIISEVTHYISIKFMISLLTGILVTLLTAAIKLDFAIIWGFIAFILNFIPNFGSIISFFLTTLFAMLQFFPHWGSIIYVAVAVLATNMILGNFVEPRWEGSDLGLSPFIILVSLSIWGYIWGFVGLILAVPLTVTIKIIFENISFLAPVAALLGNGKDPDAAPREKRKLKNLFKPKQKNEAKGEIEESVENKD